MEQNLKGQRQIEEIDSQALSHQHFCPLAKATVREVHATRQSETPGDDEAYHYESPYHRPCPHEHTEDKKRPDGHLDGAKCIPIDGRQRMGQQLVGRHHLDELRELLELRRTGEDKHPT